MPKRDVFAWTTMISGFPKAGDLGSSRRLFDEMPERSWQESPEGKKMMEFRKSLPSFKEKERLLQAIARNQATSLLKKHLENAKAILKVLIADLQFLRDQLTITQILVCRPQERLNITRKDYRLTRLEQYKNYENIPASGEVVDKECKHMEKGGNYYEFFHNTRLVKPTILHFQV